MMGAILVQFATTSVMQTYVTPVMSWICGIASLAAVFFLVMGGIHYMTSSGNPEKLEEAKKIVKNALIGLALVIASAALVGILSHAYTSTDNRAIERLPDLQAIQPKDTGASFADAIINAVTGLLRNLIEAVAEPFLNALGYFINFTPLMGNNPSVFNLWLAVVGVTDVLFVLVVALLGFHVMSYASLGFDEIELKSLIPRLAFVFLLINTSIFAIDGVIALSNAMVKAMQSSFATTDIWAVLIKITQQSSTLGVAGLLVMVAFLILVIMLLIYYVGRLISLYIGAILSPIVLLLWLIPAFKDFAQTALKTYLTLIFVLFVHTIILLLAASLFTGMLDGSTNGQPNALMALIVGIATVTALLKTQGFMQELSYAASTPRAAREMATQFTRGVSSVRSSVALPVKAARATNNIAKKLNTSAQHMKHGAGMSKALGSSTSSPSGKSTLTVHSVPLRTGQTQPAPKVTRKKS